MNIELTKKEYKTLLLLLYCGEWMMNCNKTKEDKMQRESRSLEQLLFAHAKNAGLNKWVEFDEKNQKFYPTREMEEDMHLFIDKYDNKI